MSARAVRLLAVVITVIAVLTARAGHLALANGRFPRSVRLVVRPGHPEEMALGTTFGLLTTRDDGAHWYWVCEAAIGFGGTLDPDYQLSPSGALFANTFDGLRVTRDGCHWTAVPGPLGTAYAAAVAVGPDGAIYAAASDPAEHRIFKSTDDGLSFVPTGDVGSGGDWWTSIEVAPGDARRIYVTGFRTMGGDPRQRLLFRSRDGGQTWDELATAAFVGTDNSELHVAAISPADADRVLLRLTLTGTAQQDTLYLSEDAGTSAAGGPTWTKVLDQPGSITGVAVRADGTVWAATPSLGLQRSTDGGHSFAAVPGVGYEGWCLVERADGLLFLCANDLPPDQRALTSSATGLAGSWSPRLHFADITAPASCHAVAGRDACAELWCGLKDQLGITSDAIDCGGPVDASLQTDVDAASAAPSASGCCDAGAGPSAVETALVLLGLAPRWRRRSARPTVGRAASTGSAADSPRG